MITLTVNGASHQIDADPDTPLLYALRNDLGLNGAKFGCGLGQCGACTVLLDDKPAFSCLLPIAALAGRKINTDALDNSAGVDTSDHEVNIKIATGAAIEQAAQCGYCIAGMIMRAQALLERDTRPTEAELRRHMAPNLCRCGTHMRILRAVRRAAVAMGGGVRDNSEDAL